MWKADSCLFPNHQPRFNQQKVNLANAVTSLESFRFEDEDEDDYEDDIQF